MRLECRDDPTQLSILDIPQEALIVDHTPLDDFDLTILPGRIVQKKSHVSV